MPQPEPIESHDLRSNAARLQSRGPLANPFTAHRSATDLGTRRTAQRADLGLSSRPLADIDELLELHEEAPSRRHAQRALADEMTGWVHGVHTLASVHKAAAALFGQRQPGLDGEVVSVLADQIPTLRVSSDELGALDLPAFLVRVGAADTKAGASRLLASGGITVNGRRVGEAGEPPLALIEDGAMLVRRGKHAHFLALVDAVAERDCQTVCVEAGTAEPTGDPGRDDGTRH